MTVKSSISLSDDQFAFAKSMVESGQYPSLSAVLQQGVEVLRQRQDDAELERRALKTLLAARKDGAPLTADAFDDRLDAMLAARTANRTPNRSGTKTGSHGLDT